MRGRHARGLVLTEQGELLYRTAQDVFMKLASARILLSDSRRKPTGDLRVTTTRALGTLWLTPRLHEFMKLYPDIRLQIILNDEELDLGMREADIELRFQPPTQNDLIRRKLFVVHNHVYASLDYIKKHGVPRKLRDLDKHRILIYGKTAPLYLRRINWLARAGLGSNEPDRIAALQVNSVLGLKEAASYGIGLATLPDYVVRNDSRLVTVLEEEESLPEFDVYFVYPEEMKAAKRIEVFRDFMIAKAREWSF